MRSAFFILSCLFVLIECQTFDKRYIGVGYGPYTKQLENGIIPEWNTYTPAQVKCQLKLIATKFSSVSTYTFGTPDSVTSYVPRIAAQINIQNRNLSLTVAQGVHGIADPVLQLNELTSAVQGAKEANTLYAGTVWAITINWENGFNFTEGYKILQMISLVRNNPMANGLKVGARAQNCEFVFSPEMYPELVTVMTAIVQQSDYIMCNFYPDYASSMNSVEAAVLYVSQVYARFKALAQSVNPNIEVIIGETGWPSDGVAYNGSPTSVVNLVKFWNQIGQVASQANVRVQMFESLDEPWKFIEYGFSGESYYGWWFQPNNSQSCAFTEKSTGITKTII